MSILLIIIAYCIITDINERREINAYWKNWHDNSFEFNGARFNKKFYRLENGKLLERKL